MPDLTKAELHILKDCLESVKAEVEQLTFDNDWFVSDVEDLLESSLEIVYGALGIQAPIDEEEEEDDYDD